MAVDSKMRRIKIIAVIALAALLLLSWWLESITLIR